MAERDGRDRRRKRRIDDQPGPRGRLLSPAAGAELELVEEVDGRDQVRGHEHERGSHDHANPRPGAVAQREGKAERRTREVAAAHERRGQGRLDRPGERSAAADRREVQADPRPQRDEQADAQKHAGGAIQPQEWIHRSIIGRLPAIIRYQPKGSVFFDTCKCPSHKLFLAC